MVIIANQLQENIRIPHFSSDIEIKDKENNVLYAKNFSSREELDAFIVHHEHSKNNSSNLLGIVVPLRTQYLKIFAKDLFLPNFINCALKINHLFLKIYVSIFAIMLDVTTLPIRLLTAPFRMYYNCKNPEEEHPIVPLIQGSKKGRSAIQEGVVYLCANAFEVQITPAPASDIVRKGNFSKPIALNRIPGGVRDYPATSGGTQWSVRKEDEWPAEWPHGTVATVD